jgi:hypothetical protein
MGDRFPIGFCGVSIRECVAFLASHAEILGIDNDRSKLLDRVILERIKKATGTSKS